MTNVLVWRVSNIKCRYIENFFGWTFFFWKCPVRLTKLSSFYIPHFMLHIVQTNNCCHNVIGWQISEIPTFRILKKLKVFFFLTSAGNPFSILALWKLVERRKFKFHWVGNTCCSKHTEKFKFYWAGNTCCSKHSTSEEYEKKVKSEEEKYLLQQTHCILINSGKLWAEPSFLFLLRFQIGQ